MGNYVYLTCFFLVATSSFLLGEKENEKQTVMRSLLNEASRVSKAEDALTKISDKARILLGILNADLDNIRKGDVNRFPAEYILSLRRDVAYLARVNTDKPTRKDIQRLRIVCASLDLKATNLTKPDNPYGLTWATGLPTKHGTKEEVFSSLSKNLSKTQSNMSRLSSVDDTIGDALKTAAKDISTLNDLSKENTVSDAYLLSLAQDSHLLALAGEERTPPVVASAYFQLAAEDLHVKAESAQANKKSPFDEVDTVVSTKDPVKDDAKSGYEVWYVPKGLALIINEHRRFANFSTPTSEKRIPGCYLMWTKKSEDRGPEDDVDVKDGGNGKCSVDLWTAAKKG